MTVRIHLSNVDDHRAGLGTRRRVPDLYRWPTALPLPSISNRAEDPRRSPGGESPQPKAVGVRPEVVIPCRHEEQTQGPRRIPSSIVCDLAPQVSYKGSPGGTHAVPGTRLRRH